MRADAHLSAVADPADLFSRAIETHGPELLGFLCAMVRDEDRGRELYAQLCEDLWKALPSFEWRASFRTWAYCAARNAVYRHRASASHRRLRRLTSSTLAELAQPEHSETAPHLQTANKDRVARLRERLSEGDRMLLVLRIDRELAWEDVADVLAGRILEAPMRARGAAAARKRFERIKDRLRAWMREEGSSVDR